MKFNAILKSYPSAKSQVTCRTYVFLGLLLIYTCSWVEKLSSSCGQVQRRQSKWLMIGKKMNNFFQQNKLVESR